MIGIIYKYTSPIGKIYIGQTTDEKRRRATFLNLNKSYGGVKIDRARQKYGPEKFHYEVLFKRRFRNKEDATLKLDELEEFYIQYYNSYRDGYNMTFGGYTTRGFVFSEEQKAEMSRARTGRTTRPRTEEEKQYHSEIMRRHWASKEYRELRARINADPVHRKIRSESVKGEKNGMYGKKHRSDSCKKMSESRFGELNFWYGKTKPKETKEKLKKRLEEFHSCHSVSEDTRKKISQNIKVPVKQFSKSGEFIAEFESPTIAGKIVGIDGSCIVKCCKGKRKSAGGDHWKYSEAPEYSAVEQDYNSDEWISTVQAILLTGRVRNVIYHHIKAHGVPIKKNGRKILIHKKSLFDIFGLG